ncbi:MAG: hypothetical protein AB1440_11885 [Pseudomonadota bacterium]
MAYWVEREGYSFLALSYPIETRDNLIPDVDPNFGVRDWGKLIADIAGQYIREHGLSRSFILSGWSMAGKVVRSAQVAARERGLSIALFVSLAATPPVPELAWGDWSRLKPGHGGIPDQSDLFPEWCVALDEAERLNGRRPVDDARFLSEYVGMTPLNIVGYPLRHKNGSFEIDQAEAIEDSQPFDFANYPLVAVMQPDFATDSTHAMADTFMWGFFTTQKIILDWLRGVDFPALPPLAWTRLRALVRTAPARLTFPVHGGHGFFIGQRGAQQAVAAYSRLRLEADALKAELGAVVGRTIN